MSTSETIIGIDVSKAVLDLWVHPEGRAWRCDYTAEPVSEVVAELTQLQPARVIVEATGGLETLVVSELSAAGLPVVVVNPRQVREFARASGRLSRVPTRGVTETGWHEGGHRVILDGSDKPNKEYDDGQEQHGPFGTATQARHGR